MFCPKKKKSLFIRNQCNVFDQNRTKIKYLSYLSNFVKNSGLNIRSDEQDVYTFSSPLISTLICNLMAPETLDLSERFSKLYQTSISPDKVLTSIMVWPRKSSDSLVNFCLNLDFKSLSSSQTRTLMRSDELWHSLQKNHMLLIVKIIEKCQTIAKVAKKKTLKIYHISWKAR